MRKFIMAFVCLMTMIMSADAQTEKDSVLNIMRMLQMRMNAVHNEIVSYGEHSKHCDKGEVNNECSRCVLAMKYHKTGINCRYGIGTPVCPICEYEYKIEENKKESGAYHSNKYGHYHNVLGGATLIGCSICDQERRTLDYKYYEKLKKQRYKNWKQTDEYKLRKEREQKEKNDYKKRHKKQMESWTEFFLSE